MLRHACILGGPQYEVREKIELANESADCLHVCILSKIGNCFFAVTSCNFFISAVNTCRKKLSHRATFFCGMSCKYFLR